jgi:hypothetical protein
MPRILPVILCLLFTAFPLFGDDYEPDGVRASDFEALMAKSPFNRTLNLSGSLILTGLAKIDDQQVATLLDTQSKETYLVSATPNKQGWKMVEVKPNPDLEMVTAKISFGGEVVSIRYAEHKLKPGETRPGGGSPRVEERSSGPPQRRGPPEDIRKKVGNLSDEQRAKFFSKMREMREKNSNLSEKDRLDVTRKMLEKVAKKDR